MADSSKEFNEVTSRAAFSISEEDPELADNNIAVMELSPEEAEEMQQNDGLIVEEDIIISANSLEEEIITEGTEAETVFTESEEESQTITAETEVTEETEITEESSVSTETIENTDNLTLEENEDPETEDSEKAKRMEYKLKLREARNNASETEVEADWNLHSDGIDLSDSINFVDEEDYVVPMYQDLTGHGTGIASIICANGEGGIKGVNPNVDLYSVKVLDGENKTPLSRIIKGIYWCIDNDVNIINMSFGTSTYSDAMKKAVEDAYDAGILMVGASGNNADKVKYPAAFKEVMAVAATDMPWSQILAKYGNTKANRKYFLFGVARHLVSDSFAHRIWYKNNGVVGKFISHDDKNYPDNPNRADNPKVVPNRIKVVREAVSYVISNASEPSNAGDYVDIAWALDVYNNTFVRQNLYQCIIEIAGSDSQLVEDQCDVKKIKNATHTSK